MPRSERIAHRGSVRSLIQLADGRIASGGEDDAVVIWSRDLEVELARYFHTDFVRAIVELPGGTILSASYDGTLRGRSATMIANVASSDSTRPFSIVM